MEKQAIKVMPEISPSCLLSPSETIPTALYPVFSYTLTNSTLIPYQQEVRGYRAG